MNAFLVMRATGQTPWALGQSGIGRSRLYQAASLLSAALVLSPHMVTMAKLKQGGGCPFAGAI